MSVNTLATEWLGLELRNPLIVAGSTATKYLRTFRDAEEAGAGAVVTKGIQGADPGYQAAFRATFYDRHMGWVSTGDKRLDVEVGETLIRAAKREVKIPVIANITGPGVDPEGWAALARRVEQAGADAIEGIFCGLSGLELMEHYQEQGVSAMPPYAGALISRNPEYLTSIVQAIKAATRVPFMAKISIEVNDMRDLARACERAGVDGMTAIDAPRGFAGVDIYNGGKPLIPIGFQPFGGICGPWLKPWTMRTLVQIRQSSNIPISACGGIMTWDDAAQMFMLGANTVQASSAVYLNGFKSLTAMKNGLERFLVEQGYSSLRDINGIGLAYIRSTAVLKPPVLVAEVDHERCTLCDRCLDIGSCRALSRNEDEISIERAACTGCALCSWICPVGAISIGETDDPAQAEALRRQDTVEAYLR